MNDISFYQSCRNIQDRCHSLLHTPPNHCEQKPYAAQLISIAQEVFALIREDQEFITGQLPHFCRLVGRIKNLAFLHRNLQQLIDQYTIYTIPLVYLSLYSTKEALSQRIRIIDGQLNIHHRFPLQFQKIRKIFEQGLRKQMGSINLTNKSIIAKDCYHLIGCSLTPNAIPLELDLKFNGNWEFAGIISFTNLLKNAQNSIPQFLENKKISFLINRLEEAYPLTVKQYLIRNRFSNFAEQRILGSQDYSLLDYQKDSLNLLREAPEEDLIQEIGLEIQTSLHRLEKNQVKLFLFGIARHRLSLEIKCLIKAHTLNQSRFEITLFNRGAGAQYHKIRLKEEEQAALPQKFKWVKGSTLNASFFSTLVRFAAYGDDIGFVYSFLNHRLIKDGRGSYQHGTKWLTCPRYGVCTYSSIEGWIQSKLNPQEWKLLERFKFKYTIQRLETLISEHLTLRAAFQLISLTPSDDNHLNDWQTLLNVSRAHLAKLKSTETNSPEPRAIKSDSNLHEI